MILYLINLVDSRNRKLIKKLILHRLRIVLKNNIFNNSQLEYFNSKFTYLLDSSELNNFVSPEFLISRYSLLGKIKLFFDWIYFCLTGIYDVAKANVNDLFFTWLDEVKDSELELSETIEFLFETGNSMDMNILEILENGDNLAAFIFGKYYMLNAANDKAEFEEKIVDLKNFKRK